jgi:hypothetical protein
MEETIFPICCGLCGEELHTDEKTTMNNIGQEHFEICQLAIEWERNKNAHSSITVG